MHVGIASLLVGWWKSSGSLCLVLDLQGCVRPVKLLVIVHDWCVRVRSGTFVTDRQCIPRREGCSSEVYKHMVVVPLHSLFSKD
jgi:hypothetical protein